MKIQISLSLAERPVKVLKYPKPGDTYHWSDKMMQDVVRALLTAVKINAKFSIPYMAGYSNDGKTIYIDNHVEQYFKDGDDVYDVWRYLAIHETVEKAMQDVFKLKYFLAHQIALRIERAAVEADGLDWKVYDANAKKYIKRIEEEDIGDIPHDLDLQPYIDSSDKELICYMKAKMV